MSWEECIFEILVGIFLIYIGYQIGWKENIRFLHGYHYVNVSEENRRPFTKKMGIGGVLVGVGIFVMPMINGLIGFEWGYYIGLAVMAVGVILMVYTVIRYNGSLICFQRRMK